MCRPYLPENICWLPFQLACACFSPMPFPSFPPPSFISVALKLFNLFISFLFWHRHPHFMNHYLHHCPSLPSFLQISFHLLYYLKLPILFTSFASSCLLYCPCHFGHDHGLTFIELFCLTAPSKSFCFLHSWLPPASFFFLFSTFPPYLCLYNPYVLL